MVDVDALIGSVKAARACGDATVPVSLDDARALLHGHVALGLVRGRVKDWLRETPTNASRRCWMMLDTLRAILARVDVSVRTTTPVPSDGHVAPRTVDESVADIVDMEFDGKQAEADLLAGFKG